MLTKKQEEYRKLVEKQFAHSEQVVKELDRLESIGATPEEADAYVESTLAERNALEEAANKCKKELDEQQAVYLRTRNIKTAGLLIACIAVGGYLIYTSI